MAAEINTRVLEIEGSIAEWEEQFGQLLEPARLALREVQFDLKAEVAHPDEATEMEKLLAGMAAD